MSNKYVRKGKNKEKIYRGLLSAEERREADRLLEIVTDKIPEFEKELTDKYKDKVQQRFRLGEKLSSFIDRENIPEREKMYFWEELEDFASREDTPLGRGKNRNFYRYCYLLYSYGYDIATILNWREWSDILDRNKVREDERLFKWVIKKKQNGENLYWRDFLMCLNMYMKNKETFVFSDSEIKNVFEQILQIASSYNLYVKKHAGDLKQSSTQKTNRLKRKLKKRYFERSIDKVSENVSQLEQQELESAFNTLIKELTDV